MKYEMKHAKKPDKKRKTAVKRKTIVITLSTIAAVAAAALIILNFQVIYMFIDSKIGDFTNMLSVKTGEKNEEVAAVTEGRKVENTSTEDKATEELPEEGLLDEGLQKEADSEDEENANKSIPTIKLEIYQGPLYSESDDICYYRIEAVVTGSPDPTIKFSKDNSLGSLDSYKAQVNFRRGDGPYILTATATNSEGSASDSITLSWNCNRNPDISKISFSNDTFYVGEQYDVTVEVADLDGGSMSYKWSASGGTVSDDSANTTKWTVPDAAGDYTITVVVKDGKGGSATKTESVYVGEVTVTPQTPANISLPRKENEGGYIEYGGGTYAGGSLYAGDSSSNKPCSGYISFDISGISGAYIESAVLTFTSPSEFGDPLSYLDALCINVVDWGAEPITQNDFKLHGTLIQRFTSPDISCTADKLKEELQKAISGGKSRFQIRIHFSGPYSDYDSSKDGWEYLQSNVNLNITYIP